ncbi:MAG: A/G-specific adenine glycosylase [Patescibacteria group bacterium]|nr:A/G-specific adenine glycosylase [Patescibacteria group bacterium]
MTPAAFERIVWSHYRAHRRDMPWRDSVSPYRVIVSEVMLQQTQVGRVLTRFPRFIRRFPGWKALATASNKAVLQEWSGLGYNRRALYLKRIAEALTDGGARAASVPRTGEGLRKLPGIGPNTAGAVMAFAFNAPVPFIETNIRSAYLHHFFPRARRAVPDAALMPIIERTLKDAVRRGPFKDNAREWYWALMDYGSHLKGAMPNPSRRSAHHKKQGAFEGSNRQLRAALLKRLLAGPAAESALARAFAGRWPAGAVRKALGALEREGFIALRGAPGRGGNIFRIV